MSEVDGCAAVEAERAARVDDKAAALSDRAGGSELGHSAVGRGVEPVGAGSAAEDDPAVAVLYDSTRRSIDQDRVEDVAGDQRLAVTVEGELSAATRAVVGGEGGIVKRERLARGQQVEHVAGVALLERAGAVAHGQRMIPTEGDVSLH